MADFESARAGNLKPGPVSHGDRMCKGCGKTFGTYRSYNAHHSRRDAPLACCGRHNEQSVTATVNSRNYRVHVQGGGRGGPGPRDGGPGDDRDRASQQPWPARAGGGGGPGDGGPGGPGDGGAPAPDADWDDDGNPGLTWLILH